MLTQAAMLNNGGGEKDSGKWSEKGLPNDPQAPYVNVNHSVLQKGCQNLLSMSEKFWISTEKGRGQGREQETIVNDNRRAKHREGGRVGGHPGEGAWKI